MRAEVEHWREWAVLTNEEKVALYPYLSDKEKKKIWTTDYYKVIRNNTYPHKYKDKYDARLEEHKRRRENYVER
tara:strand:- start:630 stop:851 length:222 start_codon:yes stop_codon:yes gene_type:complete